VKRLAAMVVAVALTLTACGSEPPPVKPQAVPEGLVPPGVQDGKYLFHESELAQAKDAFAKAGPESLAADGRVWELRVGDRLVGLLQITTLLPRFDLTKKSHRDQLISQIIPTGRDELIVGDVQVFTSLSRNKATYLWFADHTFNLLVVKPATGDDLDPERAMEEVIDFQTQSPTFKPVYFDDEESD
jgi:hypothetical protein